MKTVWVHRCMIISADIAPKIRALADSFGPAASGMWATPLSATGELPATHYISAGLIDVVFAEMISSPENLQAGCKDAGTTITLAECKSILSQVNIDESEPFPHMETLGLKLIIEKL